MTVAADAHPGSTADPLVVPVVEAMLERRSCTVLVEPGPTPEQLDLALRAATVVPDHGLLRPWRFIVAEGDGRARFGEALAAGAAESRPDIGPDLLEKVRQKAFLGPCLVGLVASPRPGAKVPEWEQVASAACTGYALALAAHGMGLGAVWKSVPYWDSPALARHLGLAEGERLLGWVNLGQPGRVPTGARREVDLGAVVEVLGADGSTPYRSPS